MGKYKTLGLPDRKECGAILTRVMTDPEAQPDFAKQSPGDHAHSRAASAVRRAQHNGHSIEIKTTYEITIDGKPFQGHVMVDPDGHLHCHAIPYETYGSAVEFVKSVIDIYPDAFPASCDDDRGHHHE